MPILFTSDFEEGNFTEWTNGGGIISISGTASNAIETTIVHAGTYSAKLTITNANGVQNPSPGVRLSWHRENLVSKYDAKNLPDEATYTSWFYIPQNLNTDWDNIMQWKQALVTSPTTQTRDPLAFVKLIGDGTAMAFALSYKVNAAGEYEEPGVTLADSLPTLVPVAEWFKLTSFYRWDKTLNGQITTWLNDVLLWDISGIQTEFDRPYIDYPRQFAVNNYANDTVPVTHSLYVDDIEIVYEEEAGGTPLGLVDVETTSTVSSTSGTAVCSVPSGTLDGELLVAHWVIRADVTSVSMALPSGWTEVAYVQGGINEDNSPSVKLAYRIASSEPANYTFTHASPQSVAMLRVSGADTEMVDVYSVMPSGGTGTTLFSPSVDTKKDGALLLSFFAGATASTVLTKPSDMDLEAAVTTIARNTVSSIEKPTVGYTGSKVATQSENVRWTAITWAIEPFIDTSGNSLRQDLLALLFNGASINNLARNTTSSPLTTLYVSLHTSVPGEESGQPINEATYTGYARVPVTRNSAFWFVVGNQVTNIEEIIFPRATGGSNTVTHFAVGEAEDGAGKIFYYGTLTSPLSISAGILPKFRAGDLVIVDEE